MQFGLHARQVTVFCPNKCVQTAFASYLIRVRGGCSGTEGSRSPQTSVALGTGPDTPRLLRSTRPAPPQTQRWLPRSRLCRTNSLPP